MCGCEEWEVVCVCEEWEVVCVTSLLSADLSMMVTLSSLHSCSSWTDSSLFSFSWSSPALRSSAISSSTSSSACTRNSCTILASSNGVGGVCVCMKSGGMCAALNPGFLLWICLTALEKIPVSHLWRKIGIDVRQIKNRKPGLEACMCV